MKPRGIFSPSLFASLLVFLAFRFFINGLKILSGLPHYRSALLYVLFVLMQKGITLKTKTNNQYQRFCITGKQASIARVEAVGRGRPLQTFYLITLNNTQLGNIQPG